MTKKHVIPDNEHLEHSATLLGSALAAHGFRQSGEPVQATTPASPASPPSATGGVRLENMGKLLLRRERKGRGGKTVTLLTGISATPQQLEALARVMRKSLGVGSTVEHGGIILQGDVVVRAAQWLGDHGARQVVIGN